MSALPAAARIEGSRVLLRPMTGGDRPAVEGWYREAAAAIQGLPAREAPHVQNLYYQLEAAQADASAGLLVIARREDPAPIGLLDYRVGRPADGWLSVGFVAVARRHRGWGYGSEAVRLLEAEATGQGIAERFWADVDARNGLGLYFWLRLGYRPTAPEEVFWPSARDNGIIAMIRTPENQEPRT